MERKCRHATAAPSVSCTSTWFSFGAREIQSIYVFIYKYQVPGVFPSSSNLRKNKVAKEEVIKQNPNGLITHSVNLNQNANMNVLKCI